MLLTVLFFYFGACHATNSIPYDIKYFEQNLDHFNYHSNFDGQTTFQQRYLIQDKWWKKGKGPIFFYTGNEGDITGFWDNTGFMFEIAPSFGALIVFAEHRFYGKSLPFDAVKSYQHPYVDLLTTEQTLADYAVLIPSLKKSLNATGCPVVCFGGSYGGMLSAYMRFKYPNIVDGSIAASAPIFLISGEIPRDFFFADVTEDFKNAAPGCDDKVREAFVSLKQMAAQGEKGFKQISNIFKLCKPLKDVKAYQHLLGWIRNSFTTLAMMDYPYATDFIAPLPGNPVKVACQKILTGTDVVQGLSEAAGMTYGKPSCYDIDTEFISCADPTGCGVGSSGKSWDYQACTEMLMPAGTNNVTDMFPELTFTEEERVKYCENQWNVKPQQEWVRANFWGKSIQYASNIVFSNGNLDPWHRGGVLKSPNKKLVTVMIEGGAHHLDLRASNKADPPSVIKARQIEVESIKEWIDIAKKNIDNA